MGCSVLHQLQFTKRAEGERVESDQEVAVEGS